MGSINFNKSTAIKKSNSTKYLIIITLLIIILAGWYKAIFIPFLNDDYQIIGWNQPSTLVQCFEPFYSKDVSSYYYRPLTNTIHSLCFWIFGFDSLPFRILNLIIYSVFILSLAKLLLMLKASNTAVFICTSFYALLPSHELHVAWIAGNGDVLAAVFLVLSSIYYLKSLEGNAGNLIFSAILFFAAVLSKEIAYAGILLPIIFLQLDKKRNIKRAFISTLIAAGIICVTILFSTSVIGNNIFNSPNAVDIKIITMIRNILLYLPVSFVSPEFLESLFYFTKGNLILSIFLTVIILSSVILFFIKNKNSINRKLFVVGAFWFLIFAIPVSVLFMRWYILTASIGMMIILLSINWDRIKKLILYPIFTLLIITLMVNSNEMMGRWTDAGNKTQTLLRSLSTIDISAKTKLIIWGVPDKIDRINSMKIGLEQAIHHFANNKKIDINAPIRYEGNLNSKIHLERLSENEFQIASYNSRLFPMGTKSRTVLIEETFADEAKDYQYRLETQVKRYIKSSAEIKLLKLDNNTLHIYCDGEKFKVIEM